jgi:hypothetical protein
MPAFPPRPRLISCIAPLVLVALVLPGLAGCSSAAARKLAGTWSLQHPGQFGANSPADDADTSKDDSTVEQQTMDLFDGVAAGDTAGRMQLKFHANGTLETISDFPAARSHKRWRWSVISWDKARGTMEIECVMPGESVRTTVVFLDDNTIELVPPNIHVLEMRLRFARD